MLHVQKYLRDAMFKIDETFNAFWTGDEHSIERDFILIEALTNLENVFGIKYNVWEGRLIVLNYNQIDSPKYHPITVECRSLVLDFKTLEVVSRSFDRFFNYGEDERIKGADITKLTAYEKVDGSLIGLFCFEGNWLYRTKSMIMPDSIINNNVEGITWKQRIEEGLPSPAEVRNLNVDTTYILELTCKENRVVTKYPCETGQLTLLAMRNKAGSYNKNGITLKRVCKNFGFREPREFKFDTFEACATAAKELRNLEEGYVLYDGSGVPCIKLKNPAYVAAHHLRGEGCLTEKRILDLIVINETDEYLTIFPEDFKAFEKYLDAAHIMNHELALLEQFVILLKDHSQKDFALRVKDEPYAAIAFGLRNGKTLKESKDRLTRQSAHNMILAYTVTTTETL